MPGEKFSVPELTALRTELLKGFDARDVAEYFQLFVAGHGYGISPEDAREAMARIALFGITVEALQRELEKVALTH